VLPPGYTGAVPDGYHVVRPATFSNLVIWRSFVVDGSPKPGVDAVKAATRIYPLGQEAATKAPTFVDMSGKPFNMVGPSGFQFWEMLNQVVQEEPTDTVDATTLGFWAAIGIQKGKPFAPDERMRNILDMAAKAGLGMARAITYQSREPEVKVYPDRHWEYIFVGGSHEFMKGGARNVDARILFHFSVICVTPAMVQKTIGAGSQYMTTYVDRDGDYLDGGRTYRLHLPPNIPVNNFWSVTLYDPNTRSLLRNGMRKPSLSSFDGPEQNADGSYDVYFGPAAPAGKEKNWVKTVPEQGWFAYIRLYGPLEPFFEQTWKPDDIVKA
jgi:hypothetical protein